MRVKSTVSAALAALALALLPGCMTYNDGPASQWNGNSQAGTPVKTRLSGSDTGFRILFIGTSPSERVALDELYEAAEKAGFKIEGNNYAFQNMRAEYGGFLYPIIGYGTLVITADLYKYDYQGTRYEMKDTNSTLPPDGASITLFDRVF